MKPANKREERKDRRLAANQSGKRKVVVVGRERGGDSMTAVAKSEALGGEIVASRIHHMSTVHADEASQWDTLHAKFDTQRINRNESYSKGLACTNQAESFFSRLRRMEVGTHHHCRAVPVRPRWRGFVARGQRARVEWRAGRRGLYGFAAVADLVWVLAETGVNQRHTMWWLANPVCSGNSHYRNTETAASTLSNVSHMDAVRFDKGNVFAYEALSLSPANPAGLVAGMG